MSELTDASISFDSQLNMCEKKLCVCGDEWEPGEYVVYTCAELGVRPEKEIFDFAYRANERHSVLSDVMSRAALASADFDDLEACASNHEILIGRVNSFMEVGE